MAYLCKREELTSFLERHKVRLVRENSNPLGPVYRPVSDIDALLVKELGWPEGVVYPWALRTFEDRVFANRLALDVIEFPQKRNTWTGELIK